MIQYGISLHDLNAVRFRPRQKGVDTELGSYVEFSLNHAKDGGNVNHVTFYPRGKDGIDLLRELERQAADARRWLEGRYCAECREGEVSGCGNHPALCWECAAQAAPPVTAAEDDAILLQREVA